METLMNQINITADRQIAVPMLFEPVFFDTDIQLQFRVISELYQHKYQLGIIDTLEDIVHKNAYCSPQYDGKIAISDRCVEAQDVEVALKWCYDEFRRTYLEKLAPLYTTARTAGDLTQLVNLITTLVTNGIKLDVQKVAWFGNPALANTSLNWAKGVWTWLTEAGGLIDQGVVPTLNSLSGTALTPTQAYELMQEVIDNSYAELKYVPNGRKRLHISGQLYDKVKRYLQNNAVTSGFIQEAIDGVMVNTFDGIPVIPHYDWDRTLFNNGGLENQNLILLTTVDNLVVATDLYEGSNNPSFFELYLDPKDKILYFYARFIFDTNYVFPSLMSVAR